MRADKSRVWRWSCPGWTREELSSTPFWQPRLTETKASRLQTSYIRIRKSLCLRRMLASSFRRGPHTAQSTIKAFSELPQHAFQPCCGKAEDLENVAEHLGHAKYCCDPECLPRELLGRARARRHPNCHGGYRSRRGRIRHQRAKIRRADQPLDAARNGRPIPN